jgi:hypothetical protein
MTQGHTLINTIKRGRKEGGRKEGKKTEEPAKRNRALALTDHYFYMWRDESMTFSSA